MTAIALESAAAPIGTSETDQRLTLIDALRGAALFGVLLVNMDWFAESGYPLAATRPGLLSSPGADAAVQDLIDLFVAAKAIGVFAFLFGVGFAMQIPKLKERYPRRLGALLALGLVHWLAVWSGEILTVYALAGFLLLLVHRWRAAALVAVGLVLAIFARPIIGHLYLLYGGRLSPDAANDASLPARFAALGHGNFADIIVMQWRHDLPWLVFSGATLAAIFHALGRFMVGVVVARGGYLRDPGPHLRAFAWVAAVGLPLGFVLEHNWRFVDRFHALGWVTRPASTEILAHVIASMGVVAMTAGYVATFVLLWQWRLVRRALAWLVPTGRMALTNYLSQTAINYLLFCGFGLALLGRAGVTGCVLLSVLVFGAQMVLSRWWLGQFRFGPFEWLWRWWTYGARPPMRRG